MVLFFRMWVGPEGTLAIVLIYIAIALSMLGALVGQTFGKRFQKNYLDAACVNDFDVHFDKSLILKVVLVLGFVSGMVIVSQKAYEQATYLLALDFYKLRMSASTANDLSKSGLFNSILMAMFSLSFVSIFFAKRNFNSKFWYFVNFCSVTIVCLYVLLGGGRMIVFYAIVLMLLRSLIDGYGVSRRIIIFVAILAAAMISVFYFRVPTELSAALEYYNNFFGLSSNAIFFGLYEGRGIILDLLYIVGIYFTHSLGVFSDFLYYQSSAPFAFGSYTFSLPGRIISAFFGFEFSTIYDISDPSIGYYSTFLRDPIADFGVYGGLTFVFLFSLVTGFFYNLRKYYWAFNMVFYYCALCMLMAPLISVVSSGLMFIAFFAAIILSVSLLFYLVFVSKKRN